MIKKLCEILDSTFHPGWLFDDPSMKRVDLSIKDIPVYDAQGKCKLYSFSEIYKLHMYNYKEALKNLRFSFGRRFLPAGLIAQLQDACKYEEHPFHSQVASLDEKFFMDCFAAEGLKRDDRSNKMFLVNISDVYELSHFNNDIEGETIPNTEVDYDVLHTKLYPSISIEDLFERAPGMASQVTGFRDINDIKEKLGKDASEVLSRQFNWWAMPKKSGYKGFPVVISLDNDYISFAYSVVGESKVLTARLKVRDKKN